MERYQFNDSAVLQRVVKRIHEGRAFDWRKASERRDVGIFKVSRAEQPEAGVLAFIVIFVYSINIRYDAIWNHFLIFFPVFSVSKIRSRSDFLALKSERSVRTFSCSSHHPAIDGGSTRSGNTKHKSM